MAVETRSCEMREGSRGSPHRRHPALIYLDDACGFRMYAGYADFFLQRIQEEKMRCESPDCTHTLGKFSNLMFTCIYQRIELD